MFQVLVSRRLLSWKGLLPAALLTLSVGCGGGAAEPLPGSEEARAEAPTTEASVAEDSERQGSPSPTPSPAPMPIAPPAQPWFHGLGGPQDDTGTSLAVDATGHVSVVWLSTPRQDADREPVEGERLAISLARYAPDGQALWTRTFPRNRVDSPRVVAAPSGELFLTGNAFLYEIDVGLGAASDGFLMKFSAEGAPLWQRRVGQKVYGSVAEGGGGVSVAAEEWSSAGHAPVLARYDAQGTPVWTRSLDTRSRDTRLHAVALTDSGRLLLAGRLADTLTVDGHALGTPGGHGLVLLAFERDGALAWSREWRGVDGEVTGLAVDAQGGARLVGTLGTGEAFLRALDAEGRERWSQPLTCDVGEALPQVTVDGRGQTVALCGATLSTYSAQGAQDDERTLAPGACAEGSCPVVGTALAAVPGRGLGLTGFQRHGGGEAWNQEAFVRLLTP